MKPTLLYFLTLLYASLAYGESESQLIKIYFRSALYSNFPTTSENIRTSATVTASLDNSEAELFLRSLDLKKETSLDESIKIKERPLLLAIDFYKGKTSNTKYDTLYCTDKFAYLESNPQKYLSPDSFLHRIAILIKGEKAEQDAAANP